MGRELPGGPFPKAAVRHCLLLGAALAAAYGAERSLRSGGGNVCNPPIADIPEVRLSAWGRAECGRPLLGVGVNDRSRPLADSKAHGGTLRRS
jgi:hypothetical protein